MEPLNFILTNIILPLAITFIGVYVFPRIEFYMQNRSLTSRQRKIEGLKREYRKKKLLSEYHTLIAPFAIKEFVVDLRGFLLGIIASLIIYLVFTYFFVTSNLGRFVYVISWLVATGYTAFNAFSDTIHLIQDSLAFSSYKVEAQEKMKKLGGNPEDLEKEEIKEVPV